MYFWEKLFKELFNFCAGKSFIFTVELATDLKITIISSYNKFVTLAAEWKIYARCVIRLNGLCYKKSSN